ncbi:MAG: hypothetical protein K2X57_10465, partial [Xanthobacteraceae bacterium]|nr:hypothetical protein [Xanthobacteraceae bacterium]
MKVLDLVGVGERSRERANTGAVGPKANLRRHAIMLGLLSSCAVVGQAKAACTPNAPVSNTTVTCSGTTTDQNPFNGYGTAADTGNTYNILSGASLTGTANGLVFDRGTVNNVGSIATGGSSGIVGSTDAVVNNSGTVSTTGANGNGIISPSLHVLNSGTISANGASGRALDGGGGGVDDITNSGVITANGTNGIGISGGTSSMVVNNSGNILATGTNGVAVKSNDIAVTNSGLINGSSLGVQGNNSISVTNSLSGTITAAAAGTAIKSNGLAQVDNTGDIFAGVNAIQAA